MVRQEEAYLRTENLAAGYDGKAWIREISIHASRGEIVTLIGPNGAGKSTILKSIAGQLKPVGGVVSLDGRMMEQWPETEIARRMAVMMTERMQPELMTCFDVAAMGRYPHTGRFGILSETDRAIVREALAMVHAEELEDREFSRISDGQKQRILLARAICQQPQIILLDEPTSFLDIRHKMELLTILKTLVRKKQVAVLMCAGCAETSYARLVTQLFGDHMYVSNATGCSSIWGGPAATSPYCTNKEGHGPAWCNSLFEDNAEHGLGMFTGQNKIREDLAEETRQLIAVEWARPELKAAAQAWLDTMDDGTANAEPAKAYVKALEESICTCLLYTSRCV